MIETALATLGEVAATANKVKDIAMAEIASRLESAEALEKATSKIEKASGTIDNPRYIITRNESLEGDRHPITGVEFVKKTVELPNGEYIEGVFANFESSFKAEIPKDLYLDTDKAQFKECNKQLAEAIEKNPELKSKFSEEQLEQIKEGIKDGSAPDGYVWHHEPESGVLSLVDSETHARTGHTGGRSIWGGGSDFR